jgi:hypothetical protein
MHVNADHQRLGAEDLADFVHLRLLFSGDSGELLGDWRPKLKNRVHFGQSGDALDSRSAEYSVLYGEQE